MPVIAGRMAPPKNRRNHNKTATILKSSKNGIGIAQLRQKTEVIAQILAAFSEL